MRARVERFCDLEGLSARAARFVGDCARDSVRRRGLFSLALCGGSTPRRLYEMLSGSPFREEMPWAQTHLFWSDERCVDQEHPASNYHMSRQALLERIPVPASHVHPMPMELASAELAARAYERELRDFFAGGLASFDLLLLGAGADGHTASLFPGEPSLEETERWVLAVDGRKGNPPLPRLTLTFPALNAGRHALFLTSGEEKRWVVDSVEASRGAAPALRVHPRESLLWYWAPDNY